MRQLKHAVFLAAFLGALPAPLPAQTPRPPAAEAAPAVAALARDLRALVAPVRAAGGRYGVLVVSLDRGDTLFSLDPDTPLAPASNLKLFSTAAALRYLGADFRWSTYLLAAGEVRGGVLEGDLVLYGTGDPTLGGGRLAGTAGALEALADSLRRRGVREVGGAVVGDGSFFDARLQGYGWTPEDLVRWYGAPVSALNAGENLVRPGGRPVADPARAAAERLRDALARVGVRVGGGVRVGRGAEGSAAGFHRRPDAPDGPGARVLALYQSPPLREVVRVTNHVSHNLYADALLKTVGRAAWGQGSFAAGERAVRRMLGGDWEAEALRMEDGSGLSRLDRLTARAVVALLELMSRDPQAEVFRTSLPQAADPDGLERRMRGTAAAGNLRAKTGTLASVSALSGYVTAANGERLAFAILANAVPQTARAKEVENRIGARLASFSR